MAEAAVGALHLWIRLSTFVFAGTIAGLAGGLHVLANHGARFGSYTPAHVGRRVLPHHHRRPRLGAGRHRRRRHGPAGCRTPADTLRLVASGLGVLLVLWLVPSGLAGPHRPLSAPRLPGGPAGGPPHGLDLDGRPLGPAPTDGGADGTTAVVDLPPPVPIDLRDGDGEALVPPPFAGTLPPVLDNPARRHEVSSHGSGNGNSANGNGARSNGDGTRLPGAGAARIHGAAEARRAGPAGRTAR